MTRGATSIAVFAPFLADARDYSDEVNDDSRDTTGQRCANPSTHARG